MPPILELIAEREAAANAAAEHLREQIAKLSDELALAEGELAELAITRKTLTRLTGQTDATAAADATVASTAYQQILAVFGTATAPMRAKDVCHALGLTAAPKDTEGLRAKLKRLVARHILIEAEPGLFTLAPATPAA
jgi:hypothetical protein